MSGSRPRVVAIGGGHGLAATLEGLVGYDVDLSAVVSVADDGGSSGMLRDELGIFAPGDVRRCLAALSPPGALADAIGHRFGDGSLRGHAAGNVMLAALLQRVEDPVAAIEALGDALGARGRVLPATVGPVDLCADTGRGRVVGQVAVGQTPWIERVGWVPAEPKVPVEVLTVIEHADLVVLGPGSLYTSVLAAVVPAVGAALAATSATVAYVANLAPQERETEGYGVDDHIDAVLAHGVEPDVVLVDEHQRAADRSLESGEVVRVVQARVRAQSPRHHHPELLAAALTALVGEPAALRR